MKALARVKRDPESSARLHLQLIDAPADSFRPYFAGRIPTREEKAAFVDRQVQAMGEDPVFENEIYRVEMSPILPFICLAIRRHDGRPCENWAELQQIKNELVGPENEAMKIFQTDPTGADPVNECRLWVHVDQSFRFSAGLVSPGLLAPIGETPRVASGTS
jgi:hypothetical protein